MQHTYNQMMADTTQAPTTRAQQREQTRARILAAARRLFADNGYDRTTIRAVAGEAGVNPGLVMHYFGSKEDLFAEAVSLSSGGPAAESPDDVVEHLLSSLGVKLEGMPPAAMAVLRSMLTHPEAAGEVRAAADLQMRELSAAIPGGDPVLRATLIGTTVMGAVIGRHLLGLEALRDASPQRITEILRPCFQALAGQDASKR